MRLEHVPGEAAYPHAVTTARALLLLAAIAVVAAFLVAFVARAPASVREADLGPEATDAELGSSFTDEQVARHGAYQGPGYLSIALSLLVQVAALVLLARIVVPRFYVRIADLPGGWLVKAVLVTVVVVAVMTVVALPVTYVRGFQMGHAWGLSTQSTGGWISDQLRGLLVTTVTSTVAAVAFLALVRAAPRSWWLWGWVVFSVLTIALAFLWPLVIAPLFNKFTPLEDGALRGRVVRLAEEAGVTLDDVLVADASRRTTAENAYVAGIGASKRMVVYDTLLTGGTEDETAYVVAHELGHEVHKHIWKFVALGSVSLLVGFAVLGWLAGRGSVWSWAGADGIGDVRVVPLLALFTIVGGVLFLPVQNAVSRSFERDADRAAITLTEDPDTAVSVYRRLAFRNLADLRPPRVAVWTLFSHPPIPERIENVLRAARPPGTR